MSRTERGILGDGPFGTLTRSIHSTVNRGPWGASSYRGNCDGYLIKDLLQFFGARKVLDPMTGSGTCRDVCQDLDIACTSFDLRAGMDAADPAYRRAGRQ